MVSVVTEATSASMSTGPTLGRIARIDPRTVWQHEAHDFTPWLRENADRLAEALGIELELSSAEHPVGTFSLDLIGRDISHDKPLIVENQLAGSDHGHLGQLLTYAAGSGAATIVWIATRIRDEHRQALDWLNEQTGEDIHFFGVELELVQIGDSLPAPLFNVVVLPNDWQKTVKAATSGASAMSEKSVAYTAFWQRFLDKVQAARPGWSKAKQAPRRHWFPMSAGLPAGCEITASFASGGRLRTSSLSTGRRPRSARHCSTSSSARRTSSRAAMARRSVGSDSTTARGHGSPHTPTVR
jgi:hypothetical protein